MPGTQYTFMRLRVSLQSLSRIAAAHEEESGPPYHPRPHPAQAVILFPLLFPLWTGGQGREFIALSRAGG